MAAQWAGRMESGDVLVFSHSSERKKAEVRMVWESKGFDFLGICKKQCPVIQKMLRSRPVYSGNLLYPADVIG